MTVFLPIAFHIVSRIDFRQAHAFAGLESASPWILRLAAVTHRFRGVVLVVSAELCGVTWIIGQRHLTAGNMQVLRVAVGVVQGYSGVDASAIGAGIFGIGDAVGCEVEVLLVGGRTVRGRDEIAAFAP